MMQWNQTLRFLSRWIVPPGFRDLAYLLAPSFRDKPPASPPLPPELALNSVCNQSQAGKRCFILATGPSIKQQDLRALRGECCIAVSNFFVHPDFKYIRPRYYCLACHHPPISEEAWADWMSRIDSALTRETILFLPLDDKERDERAGLFRDKDVHYLLYRGKWEEAEKSGVQLDRPVPGGQSVSIMAISIAVGLGCSEIYLLGCDHDWILHLKESLHFYPEKDHALTSHGYSEWSETDLEKEFSANAELWRQYKMVARLAASRGVSIYNATEGGLLDVFPRVRLEDVLPQS